ncbi:MAG: AmmeMemoRadiSam system radical SAM enzyme [bacterium]
MKINLFYTQLENNVISCLACSHRCKIAEGKLGVCGVRQNINGKLKLLVFEKSAAINIDPIEKKPFFHFLPGSTAFSIGTFGCNFHCLNCQNHDIAQILNRKGDLEFYNKINWGVQLTPEKAVQAAKMSGCNSIAYTYNEPTVWVEYALEIMKLAKKEGLCNVWVSNGFMTEHTINAISPFLDAINIDIKSFSDDFYLRNCQARLKPILENCITVVKKKIHLEITTLIIPTLSDDEKMISDIAEFIKQKLGSEVPWHISAFSGDISWKLKNIKQTPINKLKKAHKIGIGAGLHYVYVGNTTIIGLENTVCPKCNAVVIERIGYSIKNHLKKEKSCKCGYEILN